LPEAGLNLPHLRQSNESLIQFAKNNQITAIFVDIKKNKMDETMFASTAQHVIPEAPCPVLTAKQCFTRIVQNSGFMLLSFI